MKLFFIIIVLLIIILEEKACGQSSISGKITGLSGEPLISASVYLSGTTLGAVTSPDGSYKIDGISDGVYKIVASYIGYELEEKTIFIDRTLDTTINFLLFEDAVNYNEIIVESKRDPDWDRNLKKFEKLFFGSEYKTGSIVIENPEALWFTYNFIDGTEVFLAKSDAPLIILNKKLGYKIKFDLDRFIWNGAVCLYGYYALFEEMPTESEKEKEKIRDNRNEVYHGSLMHFLKSLYHYNIANENFKVNECDRNKFGEITLTESHKPLGADTLLLPLEGSRMKLVNFPELTQVVYSSDGWYIVSKFSAIERNLQFKSYVNENGVLFDMQGSITLHGSWSDKRIGALLPFDFQPVYDSINIFEQK